MRSILLIGTSLSVVSSTIRGFSGSSARAPRKLFHPCTKDRRQMMASLNHDSFLCLRGGPSGSL
jgi:hypothetical protein